MDKTFLSTEMLALRWNLSEHTLYGWRRQGIGPPYTKIGSSVRYDLDDVERYEKEGKLEHGKEEHDDNIVR